MSDLRQELETRLRGRVCFMGLGNADYGDDGFGIRLAERLLAAGLTNVVVCGRAPENYIGRLADQGYDHIVFLDAVELGGVPGDVVFLDDEEMTSRFPAVSTHKIPLGVLAMLAEAKGTRAWLLGMQAESMKHGEALSPVAETSVDALTQVLCTLKAFRERRRESLIA